jgi:hypothetical protein
VSTDVLEASAKAYLNAVNKVVDAELENGTHDESPRDGV